MSNVGFERGWRFTLKSTHVVNCQIIHSSCAGLDPRHSLKQLKLRFCAMDWRERRQFYVVLRKGDYYARHDDTPEWRIASIRFIVRRSLLSSSGLSIVRLDDESSIPATPD